MSKRRFVSLIALACGLAGANFALATTEARADENSYKCEYQPHPATGTCGEYCLDTCYGCECGGECGRSPLCPA